MTITVELPSELETTLQHQAAKNGQDVSAFVVQAIHEKIAKSRTFAEVCAPISQAVSAAEMSDDEVDHFFDEIREEVWREKHGE